MSILEILASGGGVILLLMTMVQIAPVKINPWRWVGRMIGRAINGEVSERLTGIEKKLDGHIDMDDRRTADGHRAQILHFNNELLRPIRHTKEEFIEVLAKIDAYEKDSTAIIGMIIFKVFPPLYPCCFPEGNPFFSCAPCKSHGYSQWRGRPGY